VNAHVVFDADDGLLRLHPAELAALPDLARNDHGGPRHQPLRDALGEAGAYQPGLGLHPMLADLAVVMADHFVQLGVQVRLGEAQVDARGWVSGEHAVLAAPLPDDPIGPPQVTLLHPTAVPAQIAALLDVSYRPPTRVSGRMHLPKMALDHLVRDTGETNRSTAVEILDALGVTDPHWRAVVCDAAAHYRARWTLWSSWPTARDTLEHRRYHFLDAGRAGFWLHEPADASDDGDVVTLTPCPPRLVWQAIEMLLPTDDDLRAAGDRGPDHGSDTPGGATEGVGRADRL